jgi:3D-(3,5/4)-trihydroxycyclohexane-1,2-dione acylhydrolase (decyclizing)
VHGRSAAADTRQARARAIRAAGSIEAALASGAVPKLIETTLAEALVLGLLRPGVR